MKTDEQIAREAAYKYDTLMPQHENTQENLTSIILTAIQAARGADGRRLDWLEANPRRVTFSTGYRGEPGCWSYLDWQQVYQDGPTLRSAIDAAMTKEASQ